MRQNNQNNSGWISDVMDFFKKAIIEFKNPVFKLIVVLTVALLSALILYKDCSSVAMYIVFTVIIFLFSLLAAILHIYEKRLSYTQKMELELKKALRDEIAGIRSSLNNDKG